VLCYLEAVRLVAFLVVLAACNDLRGFDGAWRGPRVGDAAVLTVGAGTSAALEIDHIDRHGLAGELTVDGLVDHAKLVSLAGAEADVLSNMTFDGSPLRVYLAFVDVPDGGGEALAVVALYDDKRIEVRVLRGGTQPLYGIYALAQDQGP
jgi:hypothetical protein